MINLLSNEIVKDCLWIVAVSIIIAILYKIAIMMLNKSFSKIKIEDIDNSKRIDTVKHIAKSIIFYTAIAIEILAILTIIWGPVPLTFAGIGAAAFAVAGQNLLKDIVNGVFILMENQYAVGDYVTIGGYSGILESVSLRTTIIKDFNGARYIIPNGSITSVTNNSKGDRRVEVNVLVDYSNNIDNVFFVINKVLEEINKKYSDDITEDISIQGISKFMPLGVNIRIVGFSKPLTQIKIQNEIRYELKKKFDEKNISFGKYSK